MRKTILFTDTLGFDGFLEKLDVSSRNCFLNEIFNINENYFTDISLCFSEEEIKDWLTVLKRQDKYYILESDKALLLRQDELFQQSVLFYENFLTSSVNYKIINLSSTERLIEDDNGSDLIVE